MSPEAIISEERLAPDPAAMFEDIKDLAVMLGMASDYLCEARVLTRLGLALEKDVERLKGLVDTLRGQFVGRPPQDTELDAQMEGLYRLAERLKSPDTVTQGKVGLDGLSRELTDKVLSLRSGIDALRQKVCGEPVAYTSADYVMNRWGGLQAFLTKLASFGPPLAKIVGVAFACAGVVFLVLFLTMEKEEVFLREIDGAKAKLEISQSELARIDGELDEIRKKLAVVRPDELSREEKVHVLDLNVIAYKLKDERDRVQLEARENRKTLDEALRKIETLRQKTLIQRLLRK